jgi:hypothetical protein
MRKTLLGLGVLFGGVLSAQAQNGLEKIIVEKFYVSNADDSAASVGLLPKGSVTYRIYADMLPGYNFQALYGVNGTNPHELLISTSTKFFNNEDRGATTPNGISLNNTKKNTVMLDSWFSVGATATGKIGVLKTDDTDGAIVNSDGILANTDTSAGKPLTEADGMVNGSANAVTFVGIGSELDMFDNQSQLGSVFKVNDGSIASLGGSKGPNDQNRVLIGQFTTDGIFSFKLNLQIGTPSGGTESYVAEKPAAGEIQLPSLIGNFDPKITSNIAPTVSIQAADSALVDQEIEIKALASDQDGTIASVEFFVNDVSIGKDTVAPYAVKWVAKEGNANVVAKATDNKGLSTSSDVKIIKVTKTATGVNDSFLSGADLNLYPMPVGNILTINFNNAFKGNVSYKIYDLAGHMLMQHDLGKVNQGSLENIDLSMLSAGNYVLELSSNEQLVHKKIVKH